MNYYSLLSPVKCRKGQSYFNDYYFCNLRISRITGVCLVSLTLFVKPILSSWEVWGGHRRLKTDFPRFEILMLNHLLKTTPREIITCLHIILLVTNEHTKKISPWLLLLKFYWGMKIQKSSEAHFLTSCDFQWWIWLNLLTLCSSW